MLQYLPALGNHRINEAFGTSMTAAVLGATGGLRTSWAEVSSLMKGGQKNLFPNTWFKDIVLRPAENSVCIFDSGLFSVFGLADKDKSFDLVRFFEQYAPAYRDYINYILSTLPEKSKRHVYFVNLDTDFLLGLEKTRFLNELLLNSCPHENLIGTYHAADGKKYLDELIEKFDYLAVADSYRFGKSLDGVLYSQAVCEYAKNKKPEIKIHVLGNSMKELFRRAGNLADTCDSSAYRFFGEGKLLQGSDIKLDDFWSGGFDYGFGGGMEEAKSLSWRERISDMKYSALLVELLQLYSIFATANKYSAQVMREDCPVRNCIDNLFGVPHDWWNTSGGKPARFLRVYEVSGRREYEFLEKNDAPEKSGIIIDLQNTKSRFQNKRINDWSRSTKRPILL